MIKQIILLISILMIILAACTAAGNDLSVEPEEEATKPPPALNTLPTESPAEPTQPSQEADLESENSSSSSIESGSVSPGEVDLSQLTPELPDNPEPQEAPRPGVPDLGAATAHRVSQDLAQRLTLDISEIRTVNIDSIEWPDSALGCPAPGVNYLTVITPGFKITLEASDTIYTYHTDLEDNYVLCSDDGQPVTP